ncbi:MAG: hypothetical protein PHD81_01045 [Candidatus Nanoarchaeia archaeon]|nr:hypothetical protein [Candidatus Nanoarchaeia archaeon]MDD5587677.1 hypothetical protein [Candidatus Nanoarchaeia archaeon]
MNKIYKIILLVLFLVVFLFRLNFSLSTPENSFSDDTSYANLRQADYVKENLKPMIYDELSYSGRPVNNSPLFSYFLAAISFIPWADKIILQFFMSLLVILAYLISKQIINDERSALISAFMVGFVPLAIRETLNKVSVYCIAFPLIFFMIYCILNLDKKTYFSLFLLSSLILALLSPISILVILFFIIYLVFSYAEDSELNKNEIILILSFLIITLLTNLLIYKDSLLSYGISVLWNNLPSSLSVASFKQINILSIMYHLGYIPLIFGFITIYKGITKYKKKAIFLISSLLITNLILLSLKMINFYTALVFIGLSASILSALTIYNFFKYLKLTKVAHWNKLLLSIFVILLVLFSVYPSFTMAKNTASQVPSNIEIESLQWIKQDSQDKNDIVIGTIYEGNLINYFSGKKNFFDTNFLLAPNPEKRMLDAGILFSSNSGERTISKMKENNIKYIFLSEKVKKLYNIDSKKFDTDCFEKNLQVYKLVC